MGLLRQQLLGRSGLRVSELALGTMTFGEAWGWGAPRDVCAAMLDRFLDRGGNLVDTASNYTDGESETLLGDLLQGRRDRVVLATKYTLTADPRDPNAGGNHRKNLLRSVCASLRRLRTDRIDLLWMHMWDGLTPADEVARALDDLVRGGKVLYVGYSDSPAWFMARAAVLAELRGWIAPVAVQVPYSVRSRSVESEVLPMAAAHGLSVLAWGVLDGGVLTGKYRAGDPGPRRYGDAELPASHDDAATTVAAVAEAAGCTPAQVALAWVLAQRPRTRVIPVVGARTVPQLEENLDAVEVRLDEEALRRLDAVSAVRLGFPRDFLEDEEVVRLIFGETRALIGPP